MELKIEYLPIKTLKPYEKNTRKHQKKDVDNIARSIEKFGMLDPIGIWKGNIIVEGHGRMLACKQLGMTEVPCVRLDHLTDEQRREYAIAHNATAELSEWDLDILPDELAELDLSDFDFDFGIEDDGEDEKKSEIGEEKESKYTDAINIPQYEPSGDCPPISDILDDSKYKKLLAEIDASKADEKTKNFLRLAACRHIAFNYKKIADFYAHQDFDVQRMMENSALVIIDLDDAIKNGFAELREKIEEIEAMDNEE